MYPRPRPWTEEEDTIIRQCWTDGLSASQIGMQLHSKAQTARSRNAVIGRLHRLGLTGLGGSTKSGKNQQVKASRYPKPRAPRITLARPRTLPAAPVKIIPDPDIPPEQRISLLDLEPTSCRWPIGDPQTAEFGFCNRHAVEGLVYCEGHAQRAYTPAGLNDRNRPFMHSRVRKQAPEMEDA